MSNSDTTTTTATAAAPKLFTNKPKKAQLKQAQQAMGTTSAPPSSKVPPITPPPPPPPKESFARRYKFLWPLLITVNLAVGAYIFTRTSKKGAIEEEEEPTAPEAATVAASVSENPVVPASVKIREPLPEDQQRELFKWLLEEKRKVKAKDPEEKKRIDEEKALLKQFIRAKSIPSL
ncbi:Beta-mannosyltransferase [Heracleum sosnowskyi]|uniref:Beta-mannosyltransferase n=1 Tax=Heracleum sosnowskyi TaxID=360622 RepID=A0AAD8M3L5_9APIA|nr:Beta-mannosyltransferase [Heracleum sosnowskyi]